MWCAPPPQFLCNHISTFLMWVRVPQEEGSENELVSEDHQWSWNSSSKKSPKGAVFSALVPMIQWTAQQFSPNHKQELRKHLTPHVQPSVPSRAIAATFLTHSCPTAALLTVTDASLRLPEWTQGTSWHLTLLTSVFAGVAFFTQHWGSLGGLAVQHCLFSLSTFSRVHSDPGGWSKATVHVF